MAQPVEAPHARCYRRQQGHSSWAAPHPQRREGVARSLQGRGVWGWLQAGVQSRGMVSEGRGGVAFCGGEGKMVWCGAVR